MSPGAFACKVRTVEPGRAEAGRFPRLVSTGWWVQGVLAVHGGLGLAPTRLLPVAVADSARPVADGSVSGLGPAPRSVLLVLADGGMVEVVTGRDDIALLGGPLVPRTPSRGL